MIGDYYELFRKVSGAKPIAVKAAENFFSGLGTFDGDSLEAAKAVRKYVIESGFSYDDRVFVLQDILKNRSGNCLGLALFVGVELLNRGFRPGFRIITHPLDAVHQHDLRLFEELCRGEHFDYEKPVLPTQQATDPMYRFGPLEHPLLVLEDKEFDLTNLDLDEDPAWVPPAEKRFDVDFAYVASCVLVDRAQVQFLSGRFNYRVVIALCMEAINIRPDSLQAWELLWYIGAKKKDQALKDIAKARYLPFGGDDSRFHYNAYKMTGDESHLDLALQRFPAYTDAFFEKHVMKVHDEREKRFNFAVAAWCIANSCSYNLTRFYKRRRRLMATLF